MENTISKGTILNNGLKISKNFQTEIIDYEVYRIMIIQIEFKEEMKYKNFKVTKKKDGRLFCRVPLSFEIDESGAKSHYKYKEIYGVERYRL